MRLFNIFLLSVESLPLDVCEYRWLNVCFLYDFDDIWSTTIDLNLPFVETICRFEEDRENMSVDDLSLGLGELELAIESQTQLSTYCWYWQTLPKSTKEITTDPIC